MMIRIRRNTRDLISIPLLEQKAEIMTKTEKSYTSYTSYTFTGHSAIL